MSRIYRRISKNFPHHIEYEFIQISVQNVVDKTFFLYICTCLFICLCIYCILFVFLISFSFHFVITGIVSTSVAAVMKCNCVLVEKILAVDRNERKCRLQRNKSKTFLAKIQNAEREEIKVQVSDTNPMIVYWLHLQT